MNSNTPGCSLFQGAETLKVNSTLEREEEEEMLQDQKRRQEELGNLLENAFDDLEDDDSTNESNANYQSEILTEQQAITTPRLDFQHQEQNMQREHEMHQLKMRLDSKSHALTNINKIANDASKKNDDLQKRLIITQAELDRALREKQHTHELLVDSKEKCSNLDNIIDKLRQDKKKLETENTQLVGQLETVQTVLADVQHKYDMVERDFHKRDDRKADMRIKQLEEHHRAQMELMQQQLQQVSDQLDKTKQELEQSQTRYNALQSSQENMLISKAAKINELNNALDMAHERCNQMAAKQNYEADYFRQQQCIADLHKQIASMEQTIAKLNDRVNSTTAELDLMDTLLQQHQLDDTPSQNTGPRLVGSTPLDPIDRMGHIKQELYRALGNLKQKREEVRKLERQLEERQHEVRIFREQENKSLVQIETLKDEKTRLENRIKVLQEELSDEHHKTLDNSKLLNLQKDVDTLINERDALNAQCANENTERNKINKQLKNVETDLAELNEEHQRLKSKLEQQLQDNRNLQKRTTADNVRLELERHKILLKDAQSEVERIKKLYSDIANEKESLSYQLNKIRNMDSSKEIQELRDQLASVQRTLQLAEMKSKELAKLLETEKLCHERELQALREKLQREKRAELEAAKESASNCSKCIDHLAEITKAEIQVLKLNNINSMMRKEIDELAEELKQSKAVQAELASKAQLCVEQDKLIAELKAKTVQFEEYIKSQNSPKQPQEVSSSGERSPAQPHVGDATPCSSELNATRIKRIEKRVRDEMAKLFATELKQFTIRLQETEEKSLCLQREYHLVCSELQQRNNEVDVLKQTILAEREKIEEIFNAKDESYKAILEKQKNMFQKCRHELQAKNQRISELSQELEERRTVIESERQSMKAVMEQWEKQRTSVEQVEKEWREKLETLRRTHDEAMHAAHLRYQSAKRTALNYKLYSEDKEAHMKREYERIKTDYELSLAKIEMTMNQRLELKSREVADLHSAQTAPDRPTLKQKQRNKENIPRNTK